MIGTHSTGERAETYLPPNHLKHNLDTAESSASLRPSVQTGCSNISSFSDSRTQYRSELIPTNQSRLSNLALTATLQPQTSESHRPTILHPTTGLPKGYTPIPTLLAKSVGNKVTLMKWAADCPQVSNMDRHRKGALVSLPTSVSEAQSSTSSFKTNQNLQEIQAQELLVQVPRQTEMASVMADLPKSTQIVPQSPVQAMYKLPERLEHQASKESNGPLKISVHPTTGQISGEKMTQQVVILPSNLLIHKAEEKTSSLHQQQSNGTQVAVSKVASPLCLSTNVPGFTIPENRIPIQQVAPLKDSRTVRNPPHCQQQGDLNRACFKGLQACGPKPCTQSVIPNSSAITTAFSTAEPIKSKDLKQELKTICIRDSQSILVTTRGGNTGIVKVQTSTDHSALGSLPTSPVITISPQFKAFLISKTSQTLSASAPSPISLYSNPAATGVSSQPQNQASSVIKSHSSVSSPILSAVTGSISITGQGSHAAGSALSQGSNLSAGSVGATKLGHLAKTNTAGSQFRASLLKNTVALPSISSSDFFTQAEVISKTGMKRASKDEESQVTKFILLTPSSNSTTNVPISKGTSSSTESLHNSRVMFISQPSRTSNTFVGNMPMEATTENSRQLLNTSLSSQSLKTGLSLGQPVPCGNSEALSNVKNISMHSG